jgi:hypothetical protein
MEIMLRFYLVNHSDRDIQRYSWQAGISHDVTATEAENMGDFHAIYPFSINYEGKKQIQHDPTCGGFTHP